MAKSNQKNGDAIAGLLLRREGNKILTIAVILFIGRKNREWIW